MHGYSSDTCRYWRIYTWYEQICTDNKRYTYICTDINLIHTDIIGYKHICTDIDIWDWTLTPWDWTRLDWFLWDHMNRYLHIVWYRHISTDIDRYKQIHTYVQILTQVLGCKQICTDMYRYLNAFKYTLICTDMDTYVQILTDMHRYWQICTVIDSNKRHSPCILIHVLSYNLQKYERILTYTYLLISVHIVYICINLV